MLIDTHCHLFMNPLYNNVEGVLKRASDNGISAIIVPAVETASWKKVAVLSDHPAIYPALGLHPWCADEKLDIDILEKLLIETDSVAIGEIGLDFKIENPDRTIQIAVFRTQLNLAAELDLPVIVHCRGIFSGIPCVYSIEPAGDHSLPPDLEDTILRKGRVRNRIPSMIIMPGIFGYALAGMVLDHVSGNIKK